MSKNKKIVLIVLILLSIFGFFFYSSQTNYKNGTASVPENIKTAKTVLEINGVRYEDEIVGEMSVYDFMSKLQSEGKITFKDKTYTGMGKLIEEINGLKSDGKKYWIYYVNGIEAQLGVLDYKIKPGDIVSWKMETGSF